MVVALIRSLRPEQWTKNGVVFAGVIFAMRLGDLHNVLTVFAAFWVYCALTSSLYLINDIFDVEADRRHPWKQKRPIASGRVPIGVAWTTAIVLGVGALLLGAMLGRPFLYTLIAYTILTLGYTFGLKRVAMLDVLIIAIGFVLRAAAGAVVIDVLISPWLFVCALLLALLLALTKRRQETAAAGPRAGWSSYSVGLLDRMMVGVASATMVCYALYTLSPETLAKFHTTSLIYTIPFVIYGLFRHTYLAQDEGRGERPEWVLYTDIPLIITIVLWAVVAILALYGMLPEPPIENLGRVMRQS